MLKHAGVKVLKQTLWGWWNEMKWNIKRQPSTQCYDDAIYI